MKAFVFIAVTWVVCFSGSLARGEIRTREVVYHDGEVALAGFVAWDDKQVTLEQSEQQAPGILIVHQWMGLTDYERTRAKQLAELGYIALAIDVYGQGIRPDSPAAAGKEAGKYKQDRQLLRRRVQAGLAQLQQFPAVLDEQIAAIGYCFGGTAVLELARAGAAVSGVVSFHGGLDSPEPDAGQQIRCKVLVCHGANDPFVPAADIAAFQAELSNAKVDWQMIYYANAVHSFTHPEAGNDPSRGAAYNAEADRRSWQAMRVFFQELFGSSSP